MVVNSGTIETLATHEDCLPWCAVHVRFRTWTPVQDEPV